MRRNVHLLLLLALACSTNQPPADTTATLASHAHPITGAPTDYDPLMRAMANAHLILLGEATHGTHEFYRERARITQRLITERGFTGVALEADWTDAARVDRYVRNQSSDRTAVEALGGFDRFPRWMWRNRDFADLVEWIRKHNDGLPQGAPKVGVYGLDLYGDEESRAALTQHVQEVDTQLATQLRGKSAKQQLDLIHQRGAAATDPRVIDELFFAEQNARVLMNAQEYERAELRGGESTWNIRDRHMVEMMDALQRYLLRRNGRDGVVVWAHNSHVGDARATARAQYGEWNMGQLVREHWRRGLSFTVGFTTDTGTVMAAHDWDGAPQVKELRPSIQNSHGAILHAVNVTSYLLILAEVEARAVRTPRQQRAVGVIYRPQTEMESHYYTATLAEQFDAVIHWDRTKAVTPLD